MRVTNLLLLALIIFAPNATAQKYSTVSPEDAAIDVPLKMKVYRNWSINLPSEQWNTVGTKFALKQGLGADFKAHLDGTALAVDVDADGKVDVKIETPKGHIIFVNGKRRYAVRVKTEKQQWRFAPACVMMGKIDGVKIRLIDQNNNGKFNDIGADAMVIGNGKVASLLSKVVSINDKLLSVEIDVAGNHLRYSPYTGPVATLNLEATTQGKVVAAVINSSDGWYSFGFSATTATLKVPADDYLLHSAIISFGGNTVKVKTGRATAIHLADGKSAKLTWGGPVSAEFSYVRKGNELTFDPNKIWFFGKSGEEYYGWNPLGKSPKISLVSRSGREIAEAYFAGSC